MAELMAHHIGEQQRIGRAAAAKGYGLNPIDYSRPYPSSATQTTNNLTSANLPSQAQPAPTPAPTQGNGQPAASSLGGWKGILAAVVATGAIGTGGALIGKSTNPTTQPTTTQTTPATSGPLVQDEQILIDEKGNPVIDPATGKPKVLWRGGPRKKAPTDVIEQ